MTYPLLLPIFIVIYTDIAHAIMEVTEDMFKLWAKKWQDGHLIADTVIEDGSDETRTHKVFHCLTEVCHEMDLAEPLWLDKNIKDFQRHARCRFTQDSFVEEIPFDYLEIQILEEDDY